MAILRWFALAAIGFAVVLVVLGLVPSIRVDYHDELVEVRRYADRDFVLYLAALVGPGIVLARWPQQIVAGAWALWAIALPIGTIGWLICTSLWTSSGDTYEFRTYLAQFISGATIGLNIAVIALPIAAAVITWASRRAALGSRSARSSGRASS